MKAYQLYFQKINTSNIAYKREIVGDFGWILENKDCNVTRFYCNMI